MSYCSRSRRRRFTVLYFKSWAYSRIYGHFQQHLGGAENARPENDGQRKLWVGKMQDWKMTDKNYGVWKMQEYKSSWVQPTHTVYIKQAVRDTLQSSTGMSSHLQRSVVSSSGATAVLRTSVVITDYCWHIAYKECCNLVNRKRFCAQCADAVAVMPSGCPLCRTPIDMVMRVYF